mmetsp:Transcript_38165/g.56817  ORF Transcript_38165/g.56817 Transcript_38165/m.56817 type:complete len:146 (+) Transcript_38165:2250-2687(+)
MPKPRLKWDHCYRDLWSKLEPFHFRTIASKRRNRTPLAAGVAKEGSVDETLPALVLAASVDQTQQGEDAADPTVQLLAEKTTWYPDVKGTRELLRFGIANDSLGPMYAEVLNKWFDSSHLFAGMQGLIPQSTLRASSTSSDLLLW